jgi:very-short-patch-repair endonuclease
VIFMTELFNKTSEKAKRQRLRNDMPPAEKLIWARLRGRQIEGCKFRRQYSVGAFVIDFYVPELKLAIEIDGSSHDGEEAQAYDAQRQSYIESKGIRFLRFTNRQVYQELDAVVGAIGLVVEKIRREPLPSPPLAKGRGQDAELNASSDMHSLSGSGLPPFEGGTEGGLNAVTTGCDEESIEGDL